MSDSLEKLRGMRSQLIETQEFCHAVSINKAQLGTEGNHLYDLSVLSEQLAFTLRNHVQAMIFLLAKKERLEREERIRLENDARGIPNCDHLIHDPSCLECTKTQTEP